MLSKMNFDRAREQCVGIHISHVLSCSVYCHTHAPSPLSIHSLSISSCDEIKTCYQTLSFQSHTLVSSPFFFYYLSAYFHFHFICHTSSPLHLHSPPPTLHFSCFTSPTPPPTLLHSPLPTLHLPFHLSHFTLHLPHFISPTSHLPHFTLRSPRISHRRGRRRARV